MNRPNQLRRRSIRQTGFSLIEILIVVGLIATIAAVVANQVFGGRDRGNAKVAMSQMAALSGKIEQFEMDTGALPSSLEDLVSESGNARGWLGPYSKKSELKDPWNTPLEYRVPGVAAPFAIVSLGADRKAGGTGVDADISSEQE